MTAVPMTQPKTAALGGTGTWFEDFVPGQRMRHARGSTIDEVEGQLLAKLVINTAHAHWNEHAMASVGGRLVFGLVTGSTVIGLTMQDTAERALAEVRLDRLRFTAPVHHGDTVYAYTEVKTCEPSDREDAGLVTFRHWGTKGDHTVVFTCERTVLIKRASHWSDR